MFRVLEGFSDLAHDDEVDACSGALEVFSLNMKYWGYIECLREQAEKKEGPGKTAAFQDQLGCWLCGVGTRKWR